MKTPFAFALPGFAPRFIVRLFGLALTVVSAFATVNHRPTISAVVDQRITSGSFASQSLVIGDAETSAGSLTVTKASSDATWYPTSNISITGTAPNLTVGLTTPGTNGATTITLTVTDGGGKSTATAFTLRKAAAGTAPVIQGVRDETIPMNGSYGSLPLVVNDHDTTESSLTLTASSSNTTLVPNANVVFGGVNWGRTVTVTPATSQTGRATITLTVSDGTNLTSTSFVLDVVSSNTPPTFSSVPTYQALNLGGSPTGLNFTISDTETAAADLLVTASSSNTTLVPNANIALSGTTGSRTVTITPAASTTGAATITLALNDGDIVRRTTFLFVVKDPTAAPMLFSRSSGVFILDSTTGTSYTTTFGKAVKLRDGNMRTLPFVTGYTLRLMWSDVESSTTPGAYDFNIFTNALSVLPAGQRLSIIIQGDEPSYIASTGGVTTWNDGGTLRAVPWDPYLRTRRHALYQAMAAFVVGSYPLATHPTIDVLDPYLPGGTTGVRDPSTDLSALPGYSRATLLATVQDELRSLQDNFPGKLVQIGFWKVLDGEDASYGGVASWEWIREQLLAEFNGTIRPRVGFFMENLAATRPGAAIDSYTSTPITSYAQALYDSRTSTFNGFQMLGNWTRPFSDNHVDNTLNGTPNDAIEAAYNTYLSQYAEVYISDIDNTAMQPALQSWHDYFATLNPADSPTGLIATPISSSEIDASWDVVFHGVSYDLQRKQGTGGSWSTITSPGYTGTSFSDTGRAASTQYFYQVRASNGSSTSAYSASVSATTFSAGTTVTVLSQGANDGYTTSATANATISNSSGIRAGEGASSAQQKGIISFDTSALPDTGITITSAKLRLKQGTDDSAFATLGTCMVDIRNGDFNGNQTLQTGDFSAAASATNVTQVTGAGLDGWTEATLNASGIAQINRTSRTQFRIYFNNSTASSTNITWYPGESTGNEPQLVIVYTTP